MAFNATHLAPMTLADTPLPPRTLEGWYALHQIVRIDWPRFERLSLEDRQTTDDRLRCLFESWSDLGEAGWSALYRMVGAGADIMAVHFRDRLEGLSDAARALRQAPLAAHAGPVYEFLSVVELGLYRLTAELARRQPDDADLDAWTQTLDQAAEGQRDSDFTRRRLYPRQPADMPFVCFYPMNKRREPGQNWYALSLEARASLMDEHGAVGRRYAGRVSQIISGAVGLDAWEWGVTLFAADPLELKNVVTDMRFDRASAVYAEFGRFFVGKRVLPRSWNELGLVE